ncbi:MAG TPA: phage holin family protein [Candidatus Acidoferrum sp.]|nr:phage holin family protein [Candidatus Acidoferrum sp.]
MTRLFLKYGSILLSILAVRAAFDGVFIQNVPALLVMGLALLLVNLVLKPIFLLLALPLNILTFGLFSILVNALTVKIADALVPGVYVVGFLNVLAVALLVVIFNNLLLDTRKLPQP